MILIDFGAVPSSVFRHCCIFILCCTEVIYFRICNGLPFLVINADGHHSNKFNTKFHVDASLGYSLLQ